MPSGKLTHEQLLALAGFLRQYLDMAAREQALEFILADAVQHQKVPDHWQADLEALRKTPEYRAILEAYEPVLVLIEQSAGDVDWIELMRQIRTEMKPS